MPQERIDQRAQGKYFVTNKIWTFGRSNDEAAYQGLDRNETLILLDRWTVDSPIIVGLVLSALIVITVIVVIITCCCYYLLAKTETKPQTDANLPPDYKTTN